MEVFGKHSGMDSETKDDLEQKENESDDIQFYRKIQIHHQASTKL